MGPARFFVHEFAQPRDLAKPVCSLLACVDKHRAECYTKTVLLDDANKLEFMMIQ